MIEQGVKIFLIEKFAITKRGAKGAKGTTLNTLNFNQNST